VDGTRRVDGVEMGTPSPQSSQVEGASEKDTGIVLRRCLEQLNLIFQLARFGLRELLLRRAHELLVPRVNNGELLPSCRVLSFGLRQCSVYLTVALGQPRVEGRRPLVGVVPQLLQVAVDFRVARSRRLLGLGLASDPRLFRLLKPRLDVGLHRLEHGVLLFIGLVGRGDGSIDLLLPNCVGLRARGLFCRFSFLACRFQSLELVLHCLSCGLQIFRRDDFVGFDQRRGLHELCIHNSLTFPYGIVAHGLGLGADGLHLRDLRV